MRRTVILLGCALATIGFNNFASAFEIQYCLMVDQTTWMLKGKTDAPGGIASFVVDLVGVASGVSDAPRGTFGGGAVNGFTLGNVFAANQAFAGQNTSNAASIVYGIGNFDVPPSAFGAPVPFTLVGSGIRDANGYVTLYHGTNSSDFSANFKFPQPTAFGAVFASVGDASNVAPVIGPGPNLFATICFPEPPAFLLAILGIPILVQVWRKKYARMSLVVSNR